MNFINSLTERNNLHQPSLANLTRKRSRGLIAILVFAVTYASLSLSPGGGLRNNNATPTFNVHQEYSTSSSARYQRFLREQGLVETSSHAVQEGYIEKEAVTDSLEEDSLEQATAEEEKHDDNNIINSNRAVALISFGESAAASTLVERAVMSIRRRGEFDGPVVIITDAPLERYENEFDDRVTVLNSRDEDLKLGYFESESMKYKRFKTLILDYINHVPELDDVDFVYYMDIDMLMGDRFSDLADVLSTKYNIEAEENEENPVSKLYFFRDPNSKHFAANSGFMIMNRHTSQHCLDLWREQMDNNPSYTFDQSSLNEIIKKQDEEDADTSECVIVHMESSGYLVYTINEKSMLKMVDEERLPHLIHIYNSCKADKFSEEATEQFVSVVLNLSEEEKEQHKFGKAVIKPSENEEWVGEKVMKTQEDEDFGELALKALDDLIEHTEEMIEQIETEVE